MNSDQQWIARKFLEEVDTIKLDGEPWPMHKAAIRLGYCDMIDHEFPGDDPEELALIATAGAVRDLCWQPADPEVIERYLSVRRAHLDLLKSMCTALGLQLPDELDDR